MAFDFTRLSFVVWVVRERKTFNFFGFSYFHPCSQFSKRLSEKWTITKAMHAVKFINRAGGIGRCHATFTYGLCVCGLCVAFISISVPFHALISSILLSLFRINRNVYFVAKNRAARINRNQLMDQNDYMTPLNR